TNSETLGGSNHHINAEMPGRFKHYEAENVCRNGNFYLCIVRFLDEFFVVMNFSGFSGILKNCSKKSFGKIKFLVVSNNQFNSQWFGACFQKGKGLWQYFFRNKEF